VSWPLRYGPLSLEDESDPNSTLWVLHIKWRRVELEWADLIAGPVSSETFRQAVFEAIDRWPDPMTRKQWDMTLQALFDERFEGIFGLPDPRPAMNRNPLQALIDAMDDERETLFGLDDDQLDDGGDR
jgi:hypothetical protein